MAVQVPRSDPIICKKLNRTLSTAPGSHPAPALSAVTSAPAKEAQVKTAAVYQWLCMDCTTATSAHTEFSGPGLYPYPIVTLTNLIQSLAWLIWQAKSRECEAFQVMLCAVEKSTR